MKRIAVAFANECPICYGRTSVIDSRHTEDKPGLMRRRICNECGHRFTTIEITMEDLREMIDKHSKTRNELIDETIGFLEGMRDAR